jgi:hypothetical protein
MRALTGYQLATLARSQRWVGPCVCYLGLLAFVYASQAGPAVVAYGVTAYGLFVVSAWLTTATLGAENAVARQVTAATAGSQRWVQASALLASAAVAAALAAAAVLWAAVANPAYATGVKAIVGGLALHLAFALLGLGLGALFGRPLVDAPGQAALGILAVAMLSLIVPGSPVQGCLRVLEHNPVHGFAGQLLPWIAALLACSAAALAWSVRTARGRT